MSGAEVDGPDPIVAEFLTEAHEHIDGFDDDLLALERDPEDPEALRSVFRRIHTIKGTCGFLGYPRLESVAHAGENLLSLLRAGDLVIGPEIASGLLALGDAVRAMLAGIEATGTDGDNDHAGLVARLAALQQSAGPPRIGDVLVERGVVEPADVSLAAHEQELGDPRRLGEILVDQGKAASQDVANAAGALVPRGAGSTIRVDVGLLDELLTLVSELVLARNQALEHVNRAAAAGTTKVFQRISHLTTQLQDVVTRTRMQPIATVWGRLPRLVRDLAVTCGKHVRVETEGSGTELDKAVLEAIKDPLIHLVRNAVDHGVESPAERSAAGKPAEGCVRLRAWTEGGLVRIEIRDDGAGVDVGAVGRKAVERGLATQEAVDRMREADLLGLVFAPGFSTTETVTSVSGRGVGMDVAKLHVERIGGTVDLASRPGHGTTVTLTVPLTLAIVPGLIVAAGGDRYAVPQAAVRELVRLPRGGAAAAIEYLGDAPVYRLRDRLLPLVFLDRALSAGGDPPAGRSAAIVVLHADGGSFGLVVDRVIDAEDIVVKPLGPHVSDVKIFSGATIMGDGGVALILDVAGLAAGAGLTAESGRAPEAPPAGRDETDATDSALLVVGFGPNRRLALRLGEVARLEDIPASAVEWAGAHEAVRYRGRILPLVRVSQAIDPTVPPPGSAMLHVVVHRHDGRDVGLVVDRILDIVHEPVVLQRQHRRHGVLGSAVIDGRVTDLVDVAALAAGVVLADAAEPAERAG